MGSWSLILLFLLYFLGHSGDSCPHSHTPTTLLRVTTDPLTVTDEQQFTHEQQLPKWQAKMCRSIVLVLCCCVAENATNTLWVTRMLLAHFLLFTQQCGIGKSHQCFKQKKEKQALKETEVVLPLEFHAERVSEWTVHIWPEDEVVNDARTLEAKILKEKEKKCGIVGSRKWSGNLAT